MPLRQLTEPEKYLDEILFWGRGNLPTGPQMLVLEHLGKEGEPRLYVEGRVFVKSAAVSNSAHEPGWVIDRVDISFLFNHWVGPEYKWLVEIDLDRKMNPERRPVDVYKISIVGRKVIEWAHSQGRYGAKTPPSPARLEAMREEDSE